MSGRTEGTIEVVEEAELAQRAAEWLAARLAAAAAARGSCSLAVPGGRSPLPIYRALLASPLREQVPWAALTLYFGDERCVPPDHPESNYAGALEHLVRPAGLDPARQVRRMEAERADLDQAAADYAALLPERLDVLFLGLGEDGHTASLFPGSPALAERARRVTPIEGAPKPPPRRLSITPPVIEAARDVLVVVSGAGKAQAAARALRAGDVPAALARGGTWLLDRAAAAALERTEGES
ncbi:MAG: 6-phosphogluconolactonase [Planctomycetota bacterium]